MNQLCRQVSIESPGISVKDCVFNFEVPVPDVPPKGARIKVVCAGACYRMQRSTSVTSISSNSSQFTDEGGTYSSPAHHGIRDGALFPGYEVAGVVDALGTEVSDNADIKIDQRVVLYPYDDVPHGYIEYMVVPDLKYLVPVPDNLQLSVAAMLPTGALLAKSAVIKAHKYVSELLKVNPNRICKLLIVGTGGLALWAIRIAHYHFHASDCKPKVSVTVASLRDEGFKLAKELHDVNLVQWNEDIYEKLLIERTKDACNGLVDIVIDFGTTSRSLHRSLQCLNMKGVVLISKEVADRLLPKFSRLLTERQQSVEPVEYGSIEELKELVDNVASGAIVSPPHSEFSADDASFVVEKLSQSEIPGRAILRFHDIE